MSLNECNEGESSDGVSCKYMRFSFRFVLMLMLMLKLMLTMTEFMSVSA